VCRALAAPLVMRVCARRLAPQPRTTRERHTPPATPRPHHTPHTRLRLATSWCSWATRARWACRRSRLCLRARAALARSCCWWSTATMVCVCVCARARARGVLWLSCLRVLLGAIGAACVVAAAALRSPRCGCWRAHAGD
jgi:hypothetical protein